MPSKGATPRETGKPLSDDLLITPERLREAARQRVYYALTGGAPVSDREMKLLGIAAALTGDHP